MTLGEVEANTDETGMEIEKCIEKSIAVASLTVERSDDA